MDIQKKDALKKINPFLVALFVIVVGIAVFVVFTLSKAVDTRIQQVENAKTTTQATTQEEIPPYEQAEKDDRVKVGALKKYTDKMWQNNK